MGSDRVYSRSICTCIDLTAAAHHDRSGARPTRLWKDLTVCTDKSLVSSGDEERPPHLAIQFESCGGQRPPTTIRTTRLMMRAPTSRALGYCAAAAFCICALSRWGRAHLPPPANCCASVDHERCVYRARCRRRDGDSCLSRVPPLRPSLSHGPAAIERTESCTVVMICLASSLAAASACSRCRRLLTGVARARPRCWRSWLGVLVHVLASCVVACEPASARVDGPAAASTHACTTQRSLAKRVSAPRVLDAGVERRTGIHIRGGRYRPGR